MSHKKFGPRSSLEERVYEHFRQAYLEEQPENRHFILRELERPSIEDQTEGLGKIRRDALASLLVLAIEENLI